MSKAVFHVTDQFKLTTGNPHRIPRHEELRALFTGIFEPQYENFLSIPPYHMVGVEQTGECIEQAGCLIKSLKRQVSATDVLRFMTSQGIRPATLEETISLARQALFPKPEENMLWVVGLGTLYLTEEGIFAPSVADGNSGLDFVFSTLNVTPFNDDEFVFLGILPPVAMPEPSKPR